jgi:hypothetical protein
MRALFIGIGGTGDEILAQLKDKVFASVGSIPDTLQFRLIDTLAEDYRSNQGARLGGEGSETALAGNEYLQLKDEPVGTFLEFTRKVSRDRRSIPEIARWYRADLFQQNLAEADFGLVRGAGQHRQFARMGVFLNKQRIVNMLKFAMDKCGRADGELPIWIIGSVAGGTGAGLFMDLALLARWVAEDKGVRKRIIGAAVLPDVYQDVGIDGARAYAVIRELERFQAPVSPGYEGRAKKSDSGFRFTVPYDSSTLVDLSGMLFDNLVFYNRVCENVEVRKSYFSEIADGLNLLLDQNAGDRIYNDWINAHEGKATSFNTHRIFLPIRLYQRQFVLDAALALTQGLLPRDKATQTLESGAADDRIDDARKIIETELPAAFRHLVKPASEQDYADLSEEMTPSHIVNDMLGFANAAGIYGMEIGPDRKRAAERLFGNIFEGIETVRDAKEDFDDSKLRVQNEVTLKRKQYEGDGAGSFDGSLAALRPLIVEHLEKVIDESARKYLGRHKAEAQALGRTIRVFIEIKKQLVDVRQNLERVAAGDRAGVEQAKGREKDAKVALDELTKKWMGWQNALADAEDAYLQAAHNVNRWLQRERLIAFLRELIRIADERVGHWYDGMQGWQEAFARVVQQCNNESSELTQRLVRQTKVKSASMGLNNTVDMNGYRDALRANCLKDPNSQNSFVDDLLHGLTWKPGDRPQDLELEGWPERGTLSARDFPQVLNAYLEQRINARMKEFEGMANYLRWLRDDQRDDVRGLADRLRIVTTNFIDPRNASESRKLLLLYGDNWRPDYGQNAFDNVYNSLSGDANIPYLQHNLPDAEGINAFKDKNALAILMVDNQIPYREVNVIAEMNRAYDTVRDHPSPPWRAETYHLFRCDQEAWRIEHAMNVETGRSDTPEIPGEFARLLDEPRRVELFAKALVAGVIRERSVGISGKVWACGPLGEDDERKLVFLNDPDDETDPRDLLRALITFMFDQRDRRPRFRGTLDERDVQSWVESALSANAQTLEQAITAYREAHPERFEVETVIADDGARTIDAKAFIAMALNYYLKPFSA